MIINNSIIIKHLFSQSNVAHLTIKRAAHQYGKFNYKANFLSTILIKATMSTPESHVTAHSQPKARL